jgi:gamma-glutamyl-gamma-aminobutyrate hydrolase PuuD
MKVAIVGWKTGEKSFGATVPYLDWIQRNFGEPVILSPSTDVAKVDLLILPGGPDMLPGDEHVAKSIFRTGEPDLFKEFFYRNTLDKYIKAGIPIFGICLGMQQLAVKFGSYLTQHAETYYSNPRHERVEKLNVNTAFFPEALQQHKKFFDGYKVNSMHHQLVKRAHLSKELTVIAASDHSIGHVEAFIHNELPIAGVQWHPEELDLDYISTQLIRKITNNA